MTEIRYGYTLDDLNRLARTVVVANAHWWPGGDRFDQAETAWMGIVEHLYSTTDEPSRNDLLAAGTRALVEEVKGWRRHHGLGSTGQADNTPRFAAYWYEPPATPWEERVIERIAMTQILAKVKDHQLDGLMALAATGDYQAAANALGLKYPTLNARLNKGRRAFFVHWYAPEKAPSAKGTDRRIGTRGAELSKTCARGHEFTPENTRWQPGRTAAHAKVRRCVACQAARDRARRVAAC